MLGATDRRVRAVVAQVPTISGYQQSLRRVAPDLVPALEASFAEDERRQFHGEPPATQAIVSADPSVLGSRALAGLNVRMRLRIQDHVGHDDPDHDGGRGPVQQQR